MKRQILFALIVLSSLLTACGNQPIVVPTSTSSFLTKPPVQTTATPDPCAPENLEASIKEVNDLMREFDDASQLASNLSREQVPNTISDMQRIRRVAEDQQVAACLTTLKKLQMAHMNSVINTMLAFVGGADANTLNSGLAQARQEHDQYTLEIVKLLGITPAATNAAP